MKQGLELLERQSNETERLCAAIDAYLDRESSHPLRCLDVGSGTGRLLRCLSRHIAEATALEPDEELAKVLSNRKFPFPLVVLSGRVEDFVNGTEGPFDLILLAHVMYYVHRGSWDQVIDGLRAKLSAQGSLIAVLWTTESEFYRLATTLQGGDKWPTADDLLTSLSGRMRIEARIPLTTEISVDTADQWMTLAELLQFESTDPAGDARFKQALQIGVAGARSLNNNQLLIVAKL